MKLDHIGIVVKDIEQASQDYLRIHGLKQKTKKIKSCCTSQQNRLLLELVKSTKINGYKQDGGGVTDFLKDFMNNKVINQFKKPKNPENSKLNFSSFLFRSLVL